MSNSICNQIEYIYRYAKENNIRLKKIYIDDGLSGMNFERPGFLSLLKDIENGKVKCVITKDISRLGRNYIETNYYIFNVFPKYNTQYIAIDDFVANEENKEFFYGLKTVINHKYAEDISKKIRASKHIKKNNMEYIGSVAPFGYVKSKTDGKDTLCIDENAKYIIKEIFILASSGVNINKIAYILNKNKVPTPGEYLNLKIKASFWNSGMIYRIIRNRVYIGILEERKSIGLSFNYKKRKYIPVRNRIQNTNVFPKIVSEGTFYLANKNIVSRQKINVSHYVDAIYCLKCGKSLRKFIRKRKNGKSYIYYYCPRCKNKISKAVLASILKNIITDTVSTIYFNKLDNISKKHNIGLSQDNHIICKLNSANMLNLYINNKLSMEKNVNLLYNNKIQEKCIHNFKKCVLHSPDFFISNFVDKIEIYKQIKIYFNFSI